MPIGRLAYVVRERRDLCADIGAGPDERDAAWGLPSEWPLALGYISRAEAAE